MRRSLLSARLAIPLGLAVLSACGGGSDAGPTVPPTPAPPAPPTTPIVRGEVVGPPVSASIGAAGGSIALADGSARLEIPAGAVTQATAFTLTAIRNIAPGGVGTGVRLEPANVRFAVPVTLVMPYQQAPTDTLDETGQALAWQDSTGAWFAYVNSTVAPAVARITAKDGTTKGGTTGSLRAGSGTVSAPVRRTGDLVRTYYWLPKPLTTKEIVVAVGERQGLSVYACAGERPAATRTAFAVATDGVVEDDLAPLPSLPAGCLPSTRVGTWDVFGVVGGTAVSGTVSPSEFLPLTSRAIYIAPDRVPPVNPVLVTTRLVWPERGVFKLFSWRIKIIGETIPLSVELTYKVPSVQIVNSSWYENAAIEDTVRFDIDLAQGTYLGTAAPASIEKGNQGTIITSGGGLRPVSGIDYCAPPVLSGTFEFATLQRASTVGSGTTVQFQLRAARFMRGAKVFLGVGASCGAIEDTPAVSTVVDLGTTVDVSQLPNSPGDVTYIGAPGAIERWKFTYRK